jgi:hypothetical protein
MAHYKDQYGNIIEVGSPELNPELIKGKTLVPEGTSFYTNPTTGQLNITGETLAPATPQDYLSYTDKPIDVSNLTLTPSQQQAQTSTTELQSLISQLGGETAYRAEKEKDIEGLTKIITEQATIVKNLQIEAQKLANEYAGVEDVMQVGAEGRGITKGGLAPLTASEQRKVAIKQRNVASQALTAYAAYNTATGNLQIAQDAIDKAVSAKYDPLKEEISIKKQNLELLLGSPLATAQEKALAQAQLKKQEAEEKKVNEQQGFFESIQKMYVELATVPKADPVAIGTIRRLLDKKEITLDDVAEATRLYSQNKPAEEKVLSVSEAKTLGVPYGTTQSQAAGMGIVPTTPVKPEEVYVPNIPGLTKSQARDVYSQTISPLWFRQGMENELKMNILPDKLQTLWKQAVEMYKTKKTGGGGTTIPELDYDIL